MPCVRYELITCHDESDGEEMAKLIYSMLMSLDGYTEEEGGRFGWARPDEEVHSYVNELTSSVGTYLYGRRMYEVMLA